MTTRSWSACGRRARVDFTLAPGTVTQQEVTVAGASPLLNTESPIVGREVA